MNIRRLPADSWSACLRFRRLPVKFGCLPVKFSRLPVKFGCLPVKFSRLPADFSRCFTKFGDGVTEFGEGQPKFMRSEQRNRPVEDGLGHRILAAFHALGLPGADEGDAVGVSAEARAGL